MDQKRNSILRFIRNRPKVDNLCALQSKRDLLLLYQIDFYFVFSLYALERFFRVFICYRKFLRWLTSSEVSQFNQFKCFINATTPELEIIKYRWFCFIKLMLLLLFLFKLIVLSTKQKFLRLIQSNQRKIVNFIAKQQDSSQAILILLW